MFDPQSLVTKGDTQQIGAFHSPDANAPVSMQEAAIRWIEEVYNLNSKSLKTVRDYKAILKDFDLYLHDADYRLNDNPRRVALKIQEWVTTSKKGRVVTTSTINQRLAALSSYYDFAIKFGACEINPVTFCKRPKRQIEDAAPALDIAYIQEKLSLIDASTREGLRDLAFLTLGVMTGRRLSELTGIQWKHVRVRGSEVHVKWARCKGAKVLENDLAPSTAHVLFDYLYVEYGPELETIKPDSYLFPSHSNRNRSGRLSASAISQICEDRLGYSQVHVLRHSYAVNSEQAGASLIEIGDTLGHSNYKTTADYLKAKRKTVYKHLPKLEEMYGIDRLAQNGKIE